MIHLSGFYKKTFLFFCFLSSLFFISCGQNYSGKKAPLAKKGLIDLSDWDFEKDGPVKLDGEWEFYWEKFLDKKHFEKPNIENENLAFFNIPSMWNGKSNPKNPKDILKSNGFANFVLTIKLPNNSKNLSIKLKEINTSYEISSVKNKELKKLLWNGKTGKNKQEQIPYKSTKISELIDEHKTLSDTLILSYKISNFYTYAGGPYESIILGQKETLEKNLLKQRLIAASLIGLLLVMGFYHLGLFVQRRADKASALFAFTCFSMAIRQFVMERLAFYFTGATDVAFFEWHCKIEFISMYLSVFSFICFIHFLIPSKWFNKPVAFLFILTISYISLTLFLDVQTYSALILNVYQVILLLYVVLSVYNLVKNALNNNKAALYSIIGYTPFIFTIINDIFLPNSYALFPYGFAAFIFAQSYTLSKIFTDAFKQNDILLKEVQEKEKERTTFFHNTSHELRTPLNGIIGFCELMPIQNFDSESSSRIQKIRNLAVSLKDQVNTILDLAKEQKGDLRANLSYIKPQEIFENIEILAEGLAQKKGKIEFSLKSEGDIPERLIFDEKMLLGITRNLLGNAFKFTENKEGNSILILFKFSKEDFSLQVKDSGIGIPLKDQKDIFKEFKQVEGDSRRKFEGTGLGLSIVKKYCDLLEGSIEVESKPGEGALFKLSFPYFDESHISQNSQKEKIDLASKIDLKNEASLIDPSRKEKEISQNKQYTILVTDDNEINLEVFEGILESAGYQVDLCPGGKECLDYLKSKKPDLLILDLMMPEVSGEDVLKAVRENSSIADLPVILVTARASREDKIEGLGLGADDYLAKPVDKEELLLKSKATIARLELTRSIEELSKNEKMAQLGRMMAEFSHELKNIYTGSLDEDENQEERIFKRLLEYKNQQLSSWTAIVDSLKGERENLKTRFKRDDLFLRDINDDNLKEFLKFINGLKLTEKEIIEIKKHFASDKDLPEALNLLLLTDKMLLNKAGNTRAFDLIKSILNYSRNQNKKDSDPEEITKSIYKILEKSLFKSEIDFEIQNSLQQRILFSSSDLSQILFNLIGNAIDSLNQSGTENKKILVKIEKSEEMAQLTVIDNGPGISDSIINRIFERDFSQKGEKGSGLGLFISKRLVLKNNSEILVKSEPSKTQFIIESQVWHEK